MARVGVLGDKTARSGESNTNAFIGLQHEFGTSKLPVRSFLRLPISTQLQKYMEKGGAFDKETLANVIKAGSLVPYVKKLAVTAEAIVADAFDSGGFGTWPPSDMRHKKNHQTLIETQQLRNSITSEVTEG